MKNKNLVIASLLILIAAVSRLLHLPFNFSAVTAVALFSGALFGQRIFAFIIPLMVMFISDLFINNIIYSAYFGRFMLFTTGFYWIYGSYLLIVLLSSLFLKKINILRVFGVSLTASLLFFIITNFGLWLGGGLYPNTLEGLLMCYTAAIPFFGNAVAGDLIFSTLLFGSYALITYKSMSVNTFSIKT